MTTIGPTVHPPRVYKYVTPDRIDVLESLTIRFTQPLALNDPFELKPLFNRAMSPEELADMLDRIDKLHDLKITVIDAIDSSSQVEELKDTLLALRSRIIKWDRASASKTKERLSKVVSTFGILSFSSSVTNLPLWAHYAQGGKGFAYEFNTSTAFFSSSNGLFKPVCYVDRDPENRSVKDITVDDLFFNKAKQWAYEEEWRLVAPLEQSKTKFIVEEDEIYLSDIPPSALTRIIIGANASSDLIVEIEKTIHSRKELSHVEIARVQVNWESCVLDVIPLSKELNSS